VAGLGLFALLVAVIYAGTLWSQSYQFARSYVMSNGVVAENLGVVAEVMLMPFQLGSKVTTFTNQNGQHWSQGAAACMLFAVGSRRFGIVSLKLTMRDSVWTVSAGTLYVWGSHSVALPSGPHGGAR
jgi:hypothetical protein